MLERLFMENIDQAKSIKVPVIASFSTDGKMIPLYFRYEGEKIEVGKVISVAQYPAWIKFACETVSENLSTDYFLLYNTREQYWLFEHQS